MTTLLDAGDTRFVQQLRKPAAEVVRHVSAVVQHQRGEYARSALALAAVAALLLDVAGQWVGGEGIGQPPPFPGAIGF